jgi:hypothetical protein
MTYPLYIFTISYRKHTLSPYLAAAAATCRMWFDCKPPVVTSVVAPFFRASGITYSSFRTLFPPKFRAGVAIFALDPQFCG